MEQEQITCPNCGGLIMASAKKCRHCGEWLEKPKEVQNKVLCEGKQADTIEETNSAETETKVCPFCLSTIPAKATHCKHCGQKVVNEPETIKSYLLYFASNLKKFIIITLAVALGIFLIILLFTSLLFG